MRFWLWWVKDQSWRHLEVSNPGPCGSTALLVVQSSLQNSLLRLEHTWSSSPAANWAGTAGKPAGLQPRVDTPATRSCSWENWWWFGLFTVIIQLFFCTFIWKHLSLLWGKWLNQMNLQFKHQKLQPIVAQRHPIRHLVILNRVPVQRKQFWEG